MTSKSEIDFKRLLPDNYTVGTQDFYREKTKDRLPNHIYEIQELQALENDPAIAQQKLNQLKEEYINQYEQIIKSFENDVPK